MCIICDKSYKNNLFITELNCCRNVSHIPEELNNLIKLDCNYSKVTVLPKSLKNLMELNISGTKIKVIPDFMTELVYLKCSYGYISNIPEELNKLITLVLVCNSSKISKLPNSLKYMKDLITKLPSNLDELKILNCENTLIAKLPSNLGELKILNIRNTKISHIPNCITNLIYLDCENTLITKLPSNLDKLQFLNIRNTKINNLSEIINSMRSLRTIRLGSNYIEKIITTNQIDIYYTNNIYKKTAVDFPEGYNRYVKYMNGFRKFINVLTYNKYKDTLWEIGEYYSKKRYHPDNILKYVSLD